NGIYGRSQNKSRSMACSDLLRKLKYVWSPSSSALISRKILAMMRCGLPQFYRSADGVGNDNPKEQREVSLYVLGKTVHDADDIRSQSALRSLDAGPDLALIDQSAGNYRHNPLSIARRMP